MTDLMHYEKDCSPSAIQRKYSLTYEQGYELAERLKKTQELELEVRRENEKLKDLLEKAMDDVYQMSLVNEDSRELLNKIDEAVK